MQVELASAVDAVVFRGEVPCASRGMTAAQLARAMPCFQTEDAAIGLGTAAGTRLTHQTENSAKAAATQPLMP